MEFPEDTIQYQYIKVKQNKNWGIVDYDENILVPLNFEKVSEYSNGNTIAAGYNGNTTYLYDLKERNKRNSLQVLEVILLFQILFSGEKKTFVMRRIIL